MISDPKSFDPKQYWESRLSGSFDLRGVGYGSLGRNYNEWLYRIRRKVFLRVTKSLGVDWRQSKVLDVGSGTGFYLERWNELEPRQISGADLTAVAVRELAKKFPAMEIHQLDISEETEPALGEFDAVSIFDVLFHVVDDERYATAISNLARLVRPGGHLLLSDNFVHVEPRRSEHHVSRSKAFIEETLVRSGFEILQRSPMFVLMNEPADSQSRVRRLAWAIFARCVGSSEVVGYVAGGMLYPLELLLTRFLKESATTEIMVCRRALAR